MIIMKKNNNNQTLRSEQIRIRDPENILNHIFFSFGKNVFIKF